MSCPHNLSEKNVAKQCRDLLEAHGYKVIRLQVGSFSRRGAWLSIGQRGMPDMLALKPKECIFVETKRGKGGVLSADQIAWHTTARIQGYTVIVASDMQHVVDELRRVA